MRGIAPRVAAVALLASLLQASGARAAVQERWRLRLDGDDGEDDGRAATQSWEVDTAFDVPLNDPDALGASSVDDPPASSSMAGPAQRSSIANVSTRSTGPAPNSSKEIMTAPASRQGGRHTKDCLLITSGVA